MTKRAATALLLLAVAVASLYVALAEKVTPLVGRGWNVLLISADTLRADHLGSYGYARDTSPNIDGLAKRGLVFTDVTAQAPWTLASHVSLLTGLYSSNHGVVGKQSRIGPDSVTLADVLFRSGYRTAAFTGGGYMGRSFNYHTFNVFRDDGGTDGANFEDMLAWLEGNADRPFFLLWHDFLVHCPFAPPEPHDRFSDDGYSGVVDVEPNEDEPICAGEPGWSCASKCGAYYSKIAGDMSPADLEYVLAKYDGEIRQLDERVGRILALLEKLGILEKTIVVFTSDHGESFFDRKERRRIGHHLMYEEVLRVPLILLAPGIDAPARIERPVESIDIFPTLLSLLGIDGPHVDGRNLINASPPIEEPVFSEHFYGSPEYSIKYRGVKLIHYMKDDHTELFDLDADPGEQRDLFGSGHPLEAQLLGLLEERTGTIPSRGEAASLDEDAIEQLRALGYAH